MNFSKKTEELFIKVFGIDAIFGSRRICNGDVTYKTFCRLMRIKEL